LPDGRAHGLVHLDHTSARFESEKGEFVLPLEGLQLELGGASDRLIFLSHPGHREVTIHTADHEILNHPAVANTPSLAAQATGLRNRKRRASTVLLAIVAVLIGMVASLFLARDWLVSTAASSVPVTWEIAAGDKLFAQLIANKRELKDPALVTQLQGLTAPLVQGISDQRYPLKFHIVEEPTLNAFALPGGNVVLHSGLLLAADRAEEVAGVLAHEIAHVTRRHSIRNIISSAGLYLLLAALVGDATGIIAVLADNSAFLLDRKFSRDFEREADDTGWDYLVRSDIEPRGMITFFQKMQSEEKARRDTSPTGGLEQALSVVSTHPATQERIDRLEGKWRSAAKQAGYQNIPLNYTEFKASLRTRLHVAPTDKPPG
jgi:predicted Zn-dependent protease